MSENYMCLVSELTLTLVADLPENFVFGKARAKANGDTSSMYYTGVRPKKEARTPRGGVSLHKEHFRAEEQCTCGAGVGAGGLWEAVVRELHGGPGRRSCSPRGRGAL